jgi:predicted transcriptional regulator
MIQTKPNSFQLALVYVSSPIRSLAGAFRVSRVIEEPLKDLWKIVKKQAAVNFREFKQHYDGVTNGIAMFFEKVWIFPEPLTLHELRLALTSFFPPRAYRYAKTAELQSPAIKGLLTRVNRPKTKQKPNRGKRISTGIRRFGILRDLP